MTDDRQQAEQHRASSIDRLRGRGGGSDLAARVATAVPLALLAILLVALGGWIFALGLMVLGVSRARTLLDL